MAKANISIDARRRKLVLRSPVSSPIFLSSPKRILLPAHSETLVNIPISRSFSRGLVEGSNSLPASVCLMEGLTDSTDRQCRSVFANFGHLPVSIEPHTPLGSITSHPDLIAVPLSQCLVVHPKKPPDGDKKHLLNIKLDHLPSEYRSKYQVLLNSYSQRTI